MLRVLPISLLLELAVAPAIRAQAAAANEREVDQRRACIANNESDGAALRAAPSSYVYPFCCYCLWMTIEPPPSAVSASESSAAPAWLS
jgi:hypothetical protein